MASFLDTKIHENVESPPSLAVVHVAPATTTARPPPSSFYTFRWGFLQKREINILFFFFPVFPLGRNSLSFLRAILLNKQVHPFKLQRKEVNAERACVLLSCSIPEKPPSNCSFFPSRTLPPTDRLSPCHQRCAWLPPSSSFLSPFPPHHRATFPPPFSFSFAPPPLSSTSNPPPSSHAETNHQAKPLPLFLPLDFFALSLFLRPAIDSQSLSREPTGGAESLNETDAQFLYDVGVFPFLGRIRSTYPVSK